VIEHSLIAARDYRFPAPVFTSINKVVGRCQREQVHSA
jgi:hypothetical protein